MTTFADGTRELEDRVGRGKLVGTVVVDQIYAAAQHESVWVTGPLAGHVIRNHPRGGQAKFLEQPLFENAERYFKRLADNVLDGDLVQAMTDNVAHLAGEVYDKAPREFDDLRLSAHPSVESDGKVVFDSPPVRKRLTKEELKAKARKR